MTVAWLQCRRSGRQMVNEVRIRETPEEEVSRWGLAQMGAPILREIERLLMFTTV